MADVHTSLSSVRCSSDLPPEGSLLNPLAAGGLVARSQQAGTGEFENPRDQPIPFLSYETTVYDSTRPELRALLLPNWAEARDSGLLFARSSPLPGKRFVLFEAKFGPGVLL